MPKRDNDKDPPIGRRGRRMATPIAATPILRGQNLINLLKDLGQPDTKKHLRKRALEDLMQVSRKGH